MILAGLMAALLGVDPAAAPVRHLRVICLDVSGSMGTDDGGKPRIARAAEFALGVCKRSPVDRESPVVIVYFRDGAEARTYVAAGDVERELTRISAGGGTSIRAGLERAAASLGELGREAGRVELCLLTDGEDRDLEGIKAAQETIHGLLRDRKERNLSSAVLVRSWSNDPAKVSEGLTRGGVAELVDLAKPVRAACRVRVDGDVEWVGRERRLRATLTAVASASGAVQEPAKPLVLTPSVSGSVPNGFRVPVDGNPHPFTLDLPAPAGEDPRIQVRFKCAWPSEQKLPGVGSQAHEGPGDVSISLAVPKRKLANTLSLRLSATVGHIGPDGQAPLSVRAGWEAGFRPELEPSEVRINLGRAGNVALAKGENPQALRLAPGDFEAGSIVLPVSALGPVEVKLAGGGTEVFEVRPEIQRLELAVPEPKVRLNCVPGAVKARWVRCEGDLCEAEIPIRWECHADPFAPGVSLGFELGDPGSAWRIETAGATGGPNGTALVRLTGRAVASRRVSLAVVPVPQAVGRCRLEAPAPLEIAFAAPDPVELRYAPAEGNYRLAPWQRSSPVRFLASVREGGPGMGGPLDGLGIRGPDGAILVAGQTLSLLYESGMPPMAAEEREDFAPSLSIPEGCTSAVLVVEPARMVREPAAYLAAAGVGMLAALCLALLGLARFGRPAGTGDRDGLPEHHLEDRT